MNGRIKASDGEIREARMLRAKLPSENPHYKELAKSLNKSYYAESA